MSELSKQALKVDNNQSFPNNNAGAITPSILRAFNVNMIDSNVNQSDFNTFSSSVESEFASLSGSVTSAITASSLITASFNNGTRNLTFTKGDATTFNVNIPDVSGSSGDFVSTSSFNSYTASNDAKVNSLIAATGSYVTAAITASSLVTASVNLNTITFTKGDASTFNITVDTGSGGSTINTGSFATTGSNTFYGSQTISGSVLPLSNFGGNLGASGQNWTNLYVNEIQGLSNLRLDTIKFNGVTLPLASIQPRQFFGNGIDASTAMYYCTSSSDINALRELAYVPSGSGTTANMNTLSASFASTIAGIVVGSGSAISVQDEGSILGNATSFNFNGAGVTATISAGTASITIPGGGGSIDTGSFATTGSNVFVGNQTIQQADLRMSGSIVFPNGANIGPNSVGQATVISSQTALQISSSVNSTYFAQTLTLTSSNATNINSVAVNTFNAPRTDIRGVETIGDMSGTSVGEVYLLARSGSLVLSNSTSTPTYASLSHLSSSQINANTNLIFKDNTLTGATIISGSGNIFTNPTSAAAGRVNYIGGNTNLFLNGQSDQLPTITGSAASVSGNRPLMNSNYIAGPHAWTINQAPNPGTHTYSNNIIAGIGTWTFNMLGNTGVVNVNNNLGLGSNMTLNSPSRSIAEINAGASGSCVLQIQNNSIQGFIQYQGPVSASSHQINTNIIAGTLTLNAQSQSRAISLLGNIINGTMTMNDNTVSAPTLGSFNGIQNNNINGTFTLNQRASCSINLLNNNINTWTLSNDFDASSITTPTSRLFVLNGNILFGSGNNLYASGSNEANSFTRGFNSNLFGGLAISASVVGNGGESNMISTIGVGQSLHVVGTARRNASNTTGDASTQGSAFFGRYNKEGLGFNTTAEVILAVGTGTSGSAGITRKTGFLIDSGSNAFFEGTLNVSGSTTLSGSLYIQSASAFPTQIGTSLVTWDATTGQVGQATTSTLISSSFSAGEFYSMTTLSGSSGVSASIELPNTAISNGVSIQNNSQITVQNTGVYNIQFSAQADAFDGADTIWIWFKKNGTNITDSASKLVMQNNTAAIMTVNIFDNAVPNDYFEVVWQNNAGAGKLISDAATGNIPGIPSVIVTVNQVK